MDAPKVELRYGLPPVPKLVPAADGVDMAAPVVRYPTPTQTMRVVDEVLDDDGERIDFARSVGRYSTIERRPAAVGLLERVVEEVELGEGDLDESDEPVAAAAGSPNSHRTRTRVRGGNG